MKISLVACATTLAFGFTLSVSAANAAVVTDNFDITTSGYVDLSGTASPPVDPVNVDFDVTFDPTVPNSGVAVTFVHPVDSAFSGLNLSFTNSVGPATFNLEGSDASGDFLNLQYVFSTPTIVPGSFPFVSTENDFGIYSLNGGTDVFDSQLAVSPTGAGQVTITSVSAVPEPATWAIMLIGFGGIGAAMRGSRRLATA